MPHTTKGTMEKIRKREENGIRVKGTGVGQQVKGKKWERTMKGRYVNLYIAIHIVLQMLMMRQIGKEERGYVSNAEDDTGMEAERSWTWKQEVAEIGAASTYVSQLIAAIAVGLETAVYIMHGSAL